MEQGCRRWNSSRRAILASHHSRSRLARAKLCIESLRQSGIAPRTRKYPRNLTRQQTSPPLSIYCRFKRLPNCEKAYFPIFTMRNTSRCLAPLNPRRSRKRNRKQVSRRSGTGTVAFSGPLKLLQPLQWR